MRSVETVILHLCHVNCLPSQPVLAFVTVCSRFLITALLSLTRVSQFLLQISPWLVSDVGPKHCTANWHIYATVSLLRPKYSIYDAGGAVCCEVWHVPTLLCNHHPIWTLSIIEIYMFVSVNLIFGLDFLIHVFFQAFPSVTAHTSSAPQVISGRGWGSSRGAPSGSNLWGPSRQQSGVGSIWGSSSSSSSGRQWGVSPSHHGDDPWLRFMWTAGLPVKQQHGPSILNL